MESRSMRKLVGLAIATSLTVFGAYYGSTVPVLSQWLGRSFGLDARGIGVLFAASAIGGLAGALPFGVLLDIRGPRKTIVIAATLLCAGYAAVALSRSFAVFWAGALIIDLSYAGVGLTVPFVVLLLKPEWTRRSFAFGMVSAAAPGLLFPVLAERMLATDSTEVLFRVALLAVALVAALAAAALSSRLIPRSAAIREGELTGSPTGVRAFGRQVTAELRCPRFRLLLFLMFLHATTDTFIHFWFPRFLRESFTDLPLRPGFVLSLFSGAYVGSRLALVLLPDRVGRRSLLVLPGIVGGAILFIGLQMTSPLLVALSYPLGALFWSAEAPALLGEANRSFPRSMGSFLMVSQIASYVAVAALHISMGFLMDRGLPMRAVLSLFSLFYVAFGAIALFALRPGDRDAEPTIVDPLTVSSSASTIVAP